MTTSAEPIRIVVSRTIAASPERVYDVWLDPVRAGRFLFATPEGTMIRAEIDPRVGGRYTFTDRRAEGDVEHSGEYLELDRPRRIVFSFAVDGSAADRVEVDISPSPGGCTVTLATEMAREWAEYEDRAREGWSSILASLEAVVASR